MSDWVKTGLEKNGFTEQPDGSWVRPAPTENPSTAEPQPAHECFEYQVLSYERAGDDTALGMWLKEINKDGWQLQTVTADDRFIFKRSLGYAVKIFPLKQRSVDEPR